jgi:PPOX class probable F420-dependent enzyme
MEESDMRRRVEAARVAHLATAGPDGRPHVVAICFALDGDTLYFAVDSKPKHSRDLKRLRNIAANPTVSVLVDHYVEDWSRLWWVRIDGAARIISEGSEFERAIELLIGRYSQYAQARPPGPVVAIAIDRMSAWTASGQ